MGDVRRRTLTPEQRAKILNFTALSDASVERLHQQINEAGIEYTLAETERAKSLAGYVVLGTEQDLARDLLAQALLELKREHSR